MFDCHLFDNVTKHTANDEQATIDRLVNLFLEDGCGTAFARWDDKHEPVPCLHGRRLGETGRYGVFYEDVERFVRAALAYRPTLIDPGAA